MTTLSASLAGNVAVELEGAEEEPVTVFESDAQLGVDEPTGPIDLVLLSAAGQSDVGRRRRRNEDAYAVLEDHSLYIIADGMGGYAGGDVASKLAVDAISAAFESGKFEGQADPKRPRRGNELVMSIEAANRTIGEKARKNADFHGMGTTAVVARFLPRKKRVFIGHVGDSRCYRLRAGKLVQLTRDHNLRASGVAGPFAGHLSRVLGVAPKMPVDLVVDIPIAGDLYMLCTDGLTNMVPSETLEQVISQPTKLEERVRVLLRSANEGGGRDNITVILISVLDARTAAA